MQCEATRGLHVGFDFEHCGFWYHSHSFQWATRAADVNEGNCSPAVGSSSSSSNGTGLSATVAVPVVHVGDAQPEHPDIFDIEAELGMMLDEGPCYMDDVPCEYVGVGGGFMVAVKWADAGQQVATQSLFI